MESLDITIPESLTEAWAQYWGFVHAQDPRPKNPETTADLRTAFFAGALVGATLTARGDGMRVAAECDAFANNLLREGRQHEKREAAKDH